MGRVDTAYSSLTATSVALESVRLAGVVERIHYDLTSAFVKLADGERVFITCARFDRHDWPVRPGEAVRVLVDPDEHPPAGQRRAAARAWLLR